MRKNYVPSNEKKKFKNIFYFKMLRGPIKYYTAYQN